MSKESINHEGRMLKCRLCPNCNRIMVQSYSLMGCELVCVPCQEGVGIFNGLQEVYVPETIHDALKEMYKEDLHKLAFERGGARCAKCNERGGNNCPTCKINDEFKFKDQEING